MKQHNHDFNEKLSEERPEMSWEDLELMNIMNDSVELYNGHYRLRLPFKEERVTDITAYQCRLPSLERRSSIIKQL